MLGTYSSATLADITSTEMSLTIVKVTQRRTKMPRTRMPMLGLDSRVRMRMGLESEIADIQR
jgi:hypothetical protein